MTEKEWRHACNDPWSLPEHLSGRTTDRKMRLFTVASFRLRFWDKFSQLDRRLLEVAELFADSLIGEEVLQEASNQAFQSAVDSEGHPARLAISTLASDAARVPVNMYCMTPVELVCDIFTNPFHPAPAVDPAWLRWHDATIPRLAQQMYDSRDFTSMPILADALEEAGCTNADILDHCRGPGPHVRGCWVVDLLLGRE